MNVQTKETVLFDGSARLPALKPFEDEDCVSGSLYEKVFWQNENDYANAYALNTSTWD